MRKVGSFVVDVDTDQMQRKLRAIAKHAEALANELDEIDKETCPDCGSVLTETVFDSDEKIVFREIACLECGYRATETGSD